MISGSGVWESSREKAPGCELCPHLSLSAAFSFTDIDHFDDEKRI